MNNTEFLNILKQSFITYLRTNPRSNEKLKVLHGAISSDLQGRLNDDIYSIMSLGFGCGREGVINGRYDKKNTDITIYENAVAISGIAVKYVMSNYSQNSNNYFENMLGETANIRCKHIPYFQIFIIFDLLPYYDKEGNIKKWERVSAHNMKKYIKLSTDNIDSFMHTPNKTLIQIVSIDTFGFDIEAEIHTKNQYADFFLNNDFDIKLSDINFEFGRNVLYNDYSKFLNKVVHLIKSI